MHLPTLSHRFAPDSRRVTGKHPDDTEGRTESFRAHTQRTEQGTGTGRQQETHSSHGTHSRQEERRTSGRKAGREERGARMASRLGSGGGGEQRGDTAAGREQRAERAEKEYVIYLRERGEKKTPLRLAKACKCVHIHFTQYRGIVGAHCTFFYIYYKGVYCIYLYI